MFTGANFTVTALAQTKRRERDGQQQIMQVTAKENVSYAPLQNNSLNSKFLMAKTNFKVEIKSSYLNGQHSGLLPVRSRVWIQTREIIINLNKKELLLQLWIFELWHSIFNLCRAPSAGWVHAPLRGAYWNITFSLKCPGKKYKRHRLWCLPTIQ